MVKHHRSPQRCGTKRKAFKSFVLCLKVNKSFPNHLYILMVYRNDTWSTVEVQSGYSMANFFLFCYSFLPWGYDPKVGYLNTINMF